MATVGIVVWVGASEMVGWLLARHRCPVCRREESAYLSLVPQLLCPKHSASLARIEALEAILL